MKSPVAAKFKRVVDLMNDAGAHAGPAKPTFRSAPIEFRFFELLDGDLQYLILFRQLSLVEVRFHQVFMRT